MGDREILFEGKYQRLVRQNGWEFMERANCAGIVVVLALTDDQKVVFVEQLRVPVGGKVIEFPAGLVGDVETHQKESMADAAKREFLEETGYEASKMEWVTSGPLSAASMNIMMHVFQAKSLKKIGEGGGDDTECITVHEVRLGEAEDWLNQKRQEGYLVDPKVFAGLYFLHKSNDQ